ncbi:MAG: WecB/TagA/CpsF family glycosyltransferase [Clostridia bacterium]|nr:WecB/TagA/CpsF family glycosyltransferase [Clostridia bacterium]
MKKDILGVMVDSVTMDEAVKQLSGYLDTQDAHIVVTPNAEIIKMCAEDKAFCETVNKASFISPDGVGVLYAAKVLGTPIQEKIAGCDLGFNLLFECAKKGKGVFLFGAKPGAAEIAAENLKQKVPGLIVSGTRDGYFKDEDTDDIIKQINDSGAAMLWVCLGAPKQENWMAQNKDKLRVGVMLGLGGSIDVYAGNVKRAPKWMIKMKLEWLYRLIKEPWRFSRMIKIPSVLFIARREKKRRKKNA